MPVHQSQISLSSPEMTAALARRMGAILRPGDVVLLSGGIGVGKTHFARALIQSLQIKPEDVPSPTFTLVQIYDTSAGELWHSDLYRLGHPDEVVELGLTEAFDNAICLVEWPDRLGDLTPSDALCLDFSMTKGADMRLLDLRWEAGPWETRLKGLVDV
ncbi:tRNA (adenosine(37)-N6)-threonylcarbamoyltransferase complex ATPase subunit type 1 TsaE [Rhodobacteraceae bacterium LMO-12]|nr:tRNA (adenosine(37)-N6)-threonylcarbamoyltransferase complex ATPase subunit type 1 TsaE [Rhodobacteraceae bacterium LMO-JJ12]